MAHEYAAIYSFESAGTHNDLREISKHHVLLEDGKLTLVMYDIYEAEDFTTHLYSLATMFLRATKALHQRLGSRDLPHILALEREFVDVKNAIEDAFK